MRCFVVGRFAVAPKGIGLACYILIINAIGLFVVTLIGSQGINLLFFSDDNALSLELQVLLSIINCVVLTGSAIAIINGYQQGRALLHYWTVVFFFINAWQLADRLYLIPIAITLLLVVFILYAKPSQIFFKEAQAKRKETKTGKRVDSHYNIFEAKDPTTPSKQKKNQPF